MSPWHDPLSKRHQTRRANKHKYNAEIGVSTDGRVRGSKLERAVYAILLLKERAGEISNIRTQVEIDLLPAGHMTHKIDFVVFEKKRGIDIGIEAKGGQRDQTWHEKKKVYRCVGEFPVQLWGGSHLRPMFIEEIPTGRYRVVEK